LSVFLPLTPPPAATTPVPYTTLFRSDRFGIAQRPGRGGLRHSGRAGDLGQPDVPVLRRRLPAGRPAVPVLFAHGRAAVEVRAMRSEEHTSELQSRFDLVCRLLLEQQT